MPGHRGSYPLAEQRIAAPQMVIEEGKRRAYREGVKPESNFCQLDRHKVLVDAINNPLQDHAAHDMPIVELRPLDVPTFAARGG